jgi:hypothetical protein
MAAGTCGKSILAAGILISAAASLLPCRFRKRLAVELIGDRTLSELTRLVASLEPADTIAVFVSMFRDVNNQNYASHEAAKQLATHSGAPVHVLVDTNMGIGSIGGSVTDRRAQTAAIGDIARRLLAGPATRHFRARCTVPPRLPRGLASVTTLGNSAGARARDLRGAE